MVEEEAPKPMKEVENVVLVEGDPSKTTMVGKELQQTLKDKLVKFLKKKTWMSLHGAISICQGSTDE